MVSDHYISDSILDIYSSGEVGMWKRLIEGIRLLSVIQLLLQGRTDKQNPFSVILSDPLLH